MLRGGGDDDIMDHADEDEAAADSIAHQSSDALLHAFTEGAAAVGGRGNIFDMYAEFDGAQEELPAAVPAEKKKGKRVAAAAPKQAGNNARGGSRSSNTKERPAAKKNTRSTGR